MLKRVGLYLHSLHLLVCYIEQCVCFYSGIMLFLFLQLCHITNSPCSLSYVDASFDSSNGCVYIEVPIEGTELARVEEGEL